MEEEGEDDDPLEAFMAGIEVITVLLLACPIIFCPALGE